jgi:hypothetical protein
MQRINVFDARERSGKYEIKAVSGCGLCQCFCHVGFVALKEKQLSFELVTLDLKARDNYLESYRDLSLTCKIPVLVHEGLRFRSLQPLPSIWKSSFQTQKNLPARHQATRPCPSIAGLVAQRPARGAQGASV